VALTISELAERTQVPQATLRSWESRYGFPSPERLPGGHRRYAESDVAAVEEVLRHRAAGLGLEAAVRRVAAGPVVGNASLYGELRRRHPTLVPQLLSKRSMVALSHALEDECGAQAQRPLLFAGFQRTRFLRESYARWVELSRTAGQAVVFADLDEPAPTRPGHPVEVTVPYDAAINREWFLVCDAPDRPACMVGWERPGQPTRPDSARRFEAVWSVDPVVVREAARVCAELADSYRPDWRLQEWPVLDETPAPGSADLHRATGLVTRMMGYLDAVR
jgi:DICT domain-containing protein/predicted DNA-binding transcriptional regulator AlpA